MPELRPVRSVDEIRQVVVLNRKLKKLRQVQVSERSGVATQTICHFETGHSDIRTVNLLCILAALGLALYIGEAPKDHKRQTPDGGQ